MQQPFDTAQVRRLLTHGIKVGHWSLSDLDTPSHGWTYQHSESLRIHGFTHPPYRNLLREPLTSETVQPIDPRDFDVASTTRPNAGPSDLDILPQRWPDQPSVPSLSHSSHLSDYQNSGTDRADHGIPSHLGTTGQHHSPSPSALHRIPLEPGEYLEEPPELDF